MLVALKQCHSPAATHAKTVIGVFGLAPARLNLINNWRPTGAHLVELRPAWANTDKRASTYRRITDRNCSDGGASCYVFFNSVIKGISYSDTHDGKKCETNN